MPRIEKKIQKKRNIIAKLLKALRVLNMVLRRFLNFSQLLVSLKILSILNALKV